MTNLGKYSSKQIDLLINRISNLALETELTLSQIKSREGNDRHSHITDKEYSLLIDKQHQMKLLGLEIQTIIHNLK